MDAQPPLPLERKPKLGWIGPGLIMAVSGIGASDIISATVGGALYGTTLLWALLLGAFFKFVLTEGLARWQLATGTTLLQGWAKHLPRWVLALFFSYLVLWAIAVSGALISACGLALENLSDGKISFITASLGHALAAFLFIALLQARRIGLLIKPLIAVMFLSVVICAALTFPDAGDFLKGAFLPRIPSGGAGYVFSLIGGIGGSLTLLNYNYLLLEEGRVEASNLRAVRIDLALAYLFTAIFGLSVMLIATRVFHLTGIALTSDAAVSRMAARDNYSVVPDHWRLGISSIARPALARSSLRPALLPLHPRSATLRRAMQAGLSSPRNTREGTRTPKDCSTRS